MTKGSQTFNERWVKAIKKIIYLYLTISINKLDSVVLLICNRLEAIKNGNTTGIRGRHESAYIIWLMKLKKLINQYRFVGKRKSAVLASEEDWKAIEETIYLVSIPGMRESIKKGLKTPIEKCKEEPG